MMIIRFVEVIFGLFYSFFNNTILIFIECHDRCVACEKG